MMLASTKVLDILSFWTVVYVLDQTYNTPKVYNTRPLRVHGLNYNVSGFSVNCYPIFNDAVYVSLKLEAPKFPILVKANFSVDESDFTKLIEWTVQSNGTTQLQELFSYRDLHLRKFNLICRLTFYFYDVAELQLALTAKDLVSYRREVDTDAEIKVGEETIKVHRGFLSTISPVFHAMFNDDTAESRSGIVAIKDLDLAAVVDGINFCYGESITKKSRKDIMNVYKFVHKYEITSATEKLTAWLHTNADYVCFYHNQTDDFTKDILDMIEFAEVYKIVSLSEKLTNCIISKMSVSNFWTIAKFAWKTQNKALKESCKTFYQRLDGVRENLPVNDAIEMQTSEIMVQIEHANTARILTTAMINRLHDGNFCTILKHAYDTNNEELKNGCLDYYRKNLDVTVSSEFLKLDDKIVLDVLKTAGKSQAL